MYTLTNSKKELYIHSPTTVIYTLFTWIMLSNSCMAVSQPPHRQSKFLLRTAGTGIACLVVGWGGGLVAKKGVQ